MAEVREIPSFRKISTERSPKVDPVPSRKDDALDILKRIVKGETRMRLSDTAEYIAWVMPHMRRDIIEKLHRGDYAVQETIDLHGMTLVEAEEALSSFFREAIQRRLFCVKVIHGRGLRSPHGPVLKEALKRLLHRSFSKWVLAYATAKHCDGGLGATYIILRAK
jgi:DNA-nicking Smr family endonuclease